MAIRVIIVDDHALIRESLKRLLNTYSEIEVIGCGQNGGEAFEMCRRDKPDLVLMDAVMPGVNGIEGTKLIKAWDDSIKILMLTTFSEEHLIFDALQAGVDGYVLKDIKADKLVESIQDTMTNDMMLPVEVAKKLISAVKSRKFEKTCFSQSEVEIIELMIQGFTNKEISLKLNMSYGTVRNYISDMYTKLEVDNRTSAIEVLNKLFQEERN